MQGGKHVNVSTIGDGALEWDGGEAEPLLPAGHVHIVARSDIEAVGEWLSEYRHSPQTFRAYRKEAERLLLWLGDHQLSLADLKRDRLASFEAFLSDPQPASRWIGPPQPRKAADWKPFRQPLSDASRRQSLVILQGLYSWLSEAGWVSHNPFRLMRDKRRRLDNRQQGIERYLERPLWEWLWQWVNTPEQGSCRQDFIWQRRRLIFGFAYLLAPRISEIASAQMGDFLLREGRWWWRVTGKGGKTATVPLPSDMLALLEGWRRFLDLPAHPDPADTSPLLRALDGRRGLGDNQLYRLIKRAFADAADTLETQEDNALRPMARRLRKATPHWLRHTAITHQAQHGVELRYLAMSARHSRLDTTARYLHAEAEEWHEQLASHGLESTLVGGAKRTQEGESRYTGGNRNEE
ncbi:MULTISPECIES: site-specific integrase [Halomonadaceae]|uniref:tyrosine-type recombinase/integrase n=1 Tax=Halomonadaceae TaxID=28256 RepID=UPI00159A27CA|nr:MULTISPECIES: site-specific integrase [Halomonas]QJQ96636.1 site-specific integrase [Halomonas sp. PA5]